MKQTYGFCLSLAISVLLAGCATGPAAKSAAPANKTHVGSSDVAPSKRTEITATLPETVVSIASADSDAATENELSPAYDSDDLWARIRAGYRMEPLDSPLIARHERWFVEHTEFTTAMIDRAKLYLYYIVEEVEKRDMPMEIALLPAIESAYKPYAYSRARASGLWQFIPSTGRLYGLKANWWYDGRRDVVASTRAALDYLQKLHDDFGDWHLALAAYNAGEGKIGRAIAHNRRKGLPTTFSHLTKIRAETKHYVPRLMAMVNIVKDPARYGIVLADIPNEPYFASVDAGSQVDLGVIAKLTDMTADDLHRINAGYTRWATDPNGSHHVLVPVDKKDALVEGLSNLPDDERVQWRQHEVRRGDTLHSIARQYRLSIDAIKTANQLTSNAMRVGQSLLLPISAHAPTPRYVWERGDTSDRPVIHRVRAGETLYSIARRYRVLVKQLVEWNSLLEHGILKRGQKLRVAPPGRH